MFVEVARDGVTFVGNIEGLVSVIAQGVEVKIPQGSHVSIVPGKVANQIQPEPTRPPTTKPTSTSSSPINGIPSPSVSATTVPGGPGYAPEPTTSPFITKTIPTTVSVNAKIALEFAADRQTAYPGDTIAYTYKVTNIGDVPLSDISVKDNRAGAAVFDSGDANSNKNMDVGEIWVFKSNYLIPAGESGSIINTATVFGTDPNNIKVIASANATVNLVSIIVKITSIREGDVVARTMTVGGTVNDPSITQAILNVNGTASNIGVANGGFSTQVKLADGTNTITVTVTKGGTVVASDGIELLPQP